MATALALPGIGEQGRPVEQRTLHFDLSHVDVSSDYTLHACLREHALQPHTSATLQRARETASLFRAIPDHRLTHYAKLDLPSDAVALLSVTTPGEGEGHRLVSMAIHVPQESYRVEQERVSAHGRTGRRAVHPKLSNLGIDAFTFAAATGNDDPAPYPPHIDDYKEATDAAVAYLFHHRDVLNLTPAGDYGAAYVIQNYLEANPSLSDLASAIYTPGDGWMTQVPVLDGDGHQMHGDDGKPLWTQAVNPDVSAAALGPLSWALKHIKNDPNLEGRQWTVQQGVTATDYGATREPVAHPETADVLVANQLSEVARAAADASGFNWTMQNVSPSSGFTVDSGSLTFEAPTPPENAAWTGTGFWSQPPDEGGQTWPHAGPLLADEVYLKVTTPDCPQGLTPYPQLVKGSQGEDLTTAFTVDLSHVIGPSCKAGLVLNAMHTSLAWSFSLQGKPLDGATTVGATFCDASGIDLADVPLTNTSAYGTLTFGVKNHWLRHLSAYVQFVDDGGNVIRPYPWSEVLPKLIRTTFQPDDTKKYVELISPVETICGIPLPSETTTLTIPVPPNAAAVRLLCGGLGTGEYDPGVCGIGITATVVAELALPIIVLAAGAAISNSGPVKALLADKELLFGVCAAAGFLVAGAVAADIVVTQDARPALVKLANALGPLLLKTGLKWFISQMLAEGTAERALPFVDIAFEVFSVAVTGAQLMQTTIEVLESPFVYETDVTRSIDIDVTLIPDHRFHEFPPESIGGHFSVLIVYDNNATYGRVTRPLANTPSSDPITVKFTACPAGGNLTVQAFFYAPNDWQAGQGQSGWLPAIGTDGSTLHVGNLEIVTNDVPLSAASVYQHKDKIIYDGEHKWLASAAPTTTKTTPSPYVSQGKRLVDWTAITLAQGPSQVAYSYEATGLEAQTRYTLQNLSILRDPETQYAVPPVAGFASMATPVYDLVSPDVGGQNFWLDPSQGTYDPVTNPAGGTHLRRLDVGFEKPPPAFVPANDESWGRFPSPAERYAIHPKGYVLGISYDASKLQILRISASVSADKDAAVATLASGEGFREGLMNGPRGLGVALDGRILVLEETNQRIQAFAVDGTPVPCFGDKRNPSSSMALYQPTGARYMDISVEAKGYIYVLGYQGDPAAPASYFVDIYQPSGEWLVRTTGVTAAKIVVDLMRAMYTLNYEIILGAGDRPEPSISLWMPPPPTPSA